MKDLNRMFWFSSNASHKPRPNLATLATPVYTMVLKTESQNTLSLNSDL